MKLTKNETEIIRAALTIAWEQVHAMGPEAIGMDDFTEDEVKSALDKGDLFIKWAQEDEK